MTSQLRTTAPRDCHCSAQLRPPLKGLPSRATACRYVYTGPGGVSSLATDPPGTPVAPCKIRSFTSIQMAHTHTPHRGGADEMKVKVRWQWKWNEHYLTRTRRGERKRRGTERTPTRHTWPGTGKPWKGKGKEKRRPTDNGTRPAEGGKDGSAWTNLTRRKPTPTSARAGPNLPGERRTQKHMRKGTHGGQVNKMMQPQRMQNSW